MLAFLGTQLLNKHTRVETKVYVKPTNTGLLLHYKSHVILTRLNALGYFSHKILTFPFKTAAVLQSSYVNYTRDSPL